MRRSPLNLKATPFTVVANWFRSSRIVRQPPRRAPQSDWHSASQFLQASQSSSAVGCHSTSGVSGRSSCFSSRT